MTPAEMRGLIVDDGEHGKFRIDRRVFVDPEIAALERDKVFNRCWLYIGHESEIKLPGDYVARNVGGRPIIFVRGRDGEIRAFRNACSHRGAVLCRERSGNAAKFTCFYHGWSFNNVGKLIGLADAEAYIDGFDRSELGLATVPRLENHRGLYFLSYDPKIISLSKYLGNAIEFIDYMLDFGGGGVEIAKGAQPYGMKAN